MDIKAGEEMKKTVGRSMVSFLIFIISWTVWISIKRIVEIPDLIEGILSVGDLIWIFSGAFLIYNNRDRLSFQPKRLLLEQPGWRVFIPMLLLVILYYIGVMLCTYGRIRVRWERDIFHWMITFLIVGFQEELLFRGYFLNTLSTCMSGRAANLVSAFLFLLIHVPGWLMRGYSASMIGSTGFGVFVLGVFFGYAFRKSGSLWPAMLLHAVWDLFTKIV